MKIGAPLKYYSIAKFILNCKVHLQIANCVLSSAGDSATFEIIVAKLYVSIVNLSGEDNVKLTKQLINQFKRSLYRNEYKTMPAKVINDETNM